MPATSISRWTPAYFEAALLSLLAGEAMLAAGFGVPFATGTGESLAVLHVVVLGWLSLLMVGALLQFVPVLTARPLAAPGLALPALLLLLAGLGLLLLCFLGLSGLINVPAGLSAAAVILLSSGGVLVVLMIGGTIAMARPLPLAAVFVALGLLALVLTVLLGSIFTGTLSGLLSSSRAVDILIGAPPVHALTGLFGWLTLTAIGVSYRLLPMFLLSPDRARWHMRVTLCLGGLSLVLAAGCTLAIAGGWRVTEWMPLVAAVCLGAATTYLVSILHLYRARKRRNLDLGARAATAAFGTLGFSCLLFGPALFSDRGQPLMEAALFLFIFGWLSGLGLTKLYKILAFLTWIERYGPLLGRAPTPRVQDLVRDAHAGIWFMLYFTGVAAGSLSLACDGLAGFRASCAMMLIATSGLCLEFCRIRRLTYVNADTRHPVGATGPHLHVSTGS